ncbi:Hpt domain-containing protein [Alterisphingorhabdus coralli]|uniref:Hpt domain-containing protein n=1 Tax=Alterisphingorhabdus coralli TaxID=3071408 RepID=A0AA97I1D9_9SPHN|nr:Hpt domain-containing protein [Parasphingorhabdus sp. SCSIO 66989]WOE75962.1 Hpt domain-containing protein [Parasphingorhabdus sp. SCSIO 66989]
MVTQPETVLINWSSYADTRAGLGADFARILGYFREDGTKSVAAIEEAMRASDAAKLVIPAHTLKGDSAQFGADRLSALAEQIEMTARRCVELRQQPDELLQSVVMLRQVFEQSLDALEKETNPLVQRRSFGRRNEPADTSFGRI